MATAQGKAAPLPALAGSARGCAIAVCRRAVPVCVARAVAVGITRTLAPVLVVAVARVGEARVAGAVRAVTFVATAFVTVAFLAEPLVVAMTAVRRGVMPLALGRLAACARRLRPRLVFEIGRAHV